MTNDEFSFSVQYFSKECLGRAGEITTRRGKIKTPVFMPVGTAGTVKTLTPQNLNDAGAQIILGNTYHLMLRPGAEVLNSFGGLHNMMNWHKPMLTDSGGFQVFSLNRLNKITDDGVEFASHIDGARYWLSPEESMRIQHSIGSEIMMAFDECCPYPADEKRAERALERSAAWAERCRKVHPKMFNNQALFGIVQGSVYLPLRLRSLEKTLNTGFEGLAVGGLSVGEPKALMIEILNGLMPHMPSELPRYLMGVGTPEDLLIGVERGIDMFDCVHPTRIARHGAVFTPEGRISLLNAKYKYSKEPIDKSCSCYACKNFSRGYLRHLFKAKEILGLHLASLHNVTFMINLMNNIRSALIENRFCEFRDEFLARYLK